MTAYHSSVTYMDSH